MQELIVKNSDKNNLEKRIGMPRFKKSVLKILSTGIIASMLYLGIPAKPAHANTPENDGKQTTEVAKPLNLNPSTISYKQIHEQAYNNLIKEGSELAKEDLEKAIEKFYEAIQLDPEKAKKQSFSLSEEARPAYFRAMHKAGLLEIMQEPEKKKKSHTGTYIIIGLGAVGVGGLIYYLLNKKKDDGEQPQPPPDNTVDLHFKIVNATEGILVEDYVVSKVTPNTNVTLSISELKNKYGFSGVDNSRIIIRGPLDNCEFVDIETDGDSTFLFDSNKYSAYNYHFTVFLLPEQTSEREYEKLEEWVSKGAGKLYFTPNWTYHRQDEDGATGPQAPIDRAVNMINKSIDHTDKELISYGKLTKKASGGDMIIGYYLASPPDVGYHSRGPPPVAFVNANNVFDDVFRTRVFVSEISELIGMFDNLNPSNSYSYLTDSSGNLTQHGIQFLNYLFVKDTQKIGASSPASAAAALNALNQLGGLSVNIGNGVSVGLRGNNVDVRYKGKSVDVATATGLVSGGLRNATNINLALGNNVNASFASVLSPYEQLVSAQGSARLGKSGIDVGVRGIVDVKNNNNAVGLSVGRNTNGLGFALSYDVSNAYNIKSDAFRLSTNFDLAGNRIALTGSYIETNGAIPVKSLAIGASAGLDKIIKGLSITAGYGDNVLGSGRIASGYFGLSQQMPIGNLVISVIGADNKVRDYRIAYTFSIKGF